MRELDAFQSSGVWATRTGHPSTRWNSKRTNKGVRANMKLSVETKVATAVTAGFITLTAIAIGQGNREGKTSGLDGYSPPNNPKVNTYISKEAYDSSLQPSQVIDAIRL